MSNAATLGIIAGGGALPLRLIEACQAQQRPFFILALEGAADMQAIAPLPHAVVHMGGVGDIMRHLRNANVKEVVMAGSVRRPTVRSLRLDGAGVKLLARLGVAFFSGDDALLKAVVAFFEDEGFKVIGSDELLSGLIAQEGILGNVKPDKLAAADITQGMRIAKAIGGLDIGQAVIVSNGCVLGVEAAEGTAELITRCSKFRHDTKSGVLVKVMKPAQEKRVDRPAIGVETVEQVHAAGFAGIAIEAGGAIILDKEKTIATADRLGIFIAGVRWP
jgi:DUF1009 family protein